MDLRTSCFHHIMKLSGTYYTDYNSGDLFTTLYRDIEEIPSILTTTFFNAVSSFVSAIGLIFFLLTLQADLLIILLIFQVVLYMIQKKNNKKIGMFTEDTRSAIGKLNSSSQEIISNLFAFTVGGLKQYFFHKHNKLEKEYSQVNIRTSLLLTYNTSIINVINSLTVASILGYGGYKVIIGSLSYGGLVSFNLYSQRFMSPILQLVQFNIDLTSCSIAWNRYKKLINIPITIDSGTVNTVFEGNVKMENVHFSYDNKAPVLNGVNMVFNKNNVHALVGHSGVGKTTIIHLLYRLWDISHGNITIDEYNIKELDIEVLRNQISIVSQNIFLMNDTIYNNIVLGNEITDDELNDVLKKADIYKFISSLPDKLDTVVGEDGIKLSGGEKQRISIARALLKKSPILIFDEATSMLDNETEDKIISILLQLSQEKTIILIAHRLSTVKSANVIYILNDGKVVETGNHEELMSKEGYYYKLFNIGGGRHGY